MKKFRFLLLALSVATIMTNCKKDEQPEQTASDNYSSLAQFYSEKAPKMQYYTINAITGGTFTTPQGTVVNIPANAFKTKMDNTVSGDVTIEFKDIYKKSDMLLANVPTVTLWGAPIKSGGEFFIKAVQNNESLKIASGKKIEVIQPLNGMAADSGMLPMILAQDTAAWSGWEVTGADTVIITATNYIFNLYQFNTPIDSGSWCNSDNPTFFNNYQQTTLTLNPLDDLESYHPDVFLVFKDINCMVHLYRSTTAFPYYYAPIGLECTAVALGVKDGKLYSAFVPITISSNKIVNFKLEETTSDEFTNKLDNLN